MIGICFSGGRGDRSFAGPRAGRPGRGCRATPLAVLLGAQGVSRALQTAVKEKSAADPPCSGVKRGVVIGLRSKTTRCGRYGNGYPGRRAVGRGGPLRSRHGGTQGRAKRRWVKT